MVLNSGKKRKCHFQSVRLQLLCRLYRCSHTLRIQRHVSFGAQCRRRIRPIETHTARNRGNVVDKTAARNTDCGNAKEQPISEIASSSRRSAAVTVRWPYSAPICSRRNLNSEAGPAQAPYRREGTSRLRRGRSSCRVICPPRRARCRVEAHYVLRPATSASHSGILVRRRAAERLGRCGAYCRDHLNEAFGGAWRGGKVAHTCRRNQHVHLPP